MHLDGGEVAQDVRAIDELRPIVLDVLTRGEMAVAAVVGLRDVGERLHLARRQRSVGNGHTQHVGVELQVDAVHQAQRLELVFCQRAGDATLHLVAELGDAVGDEGGVELVVAIHQFTPGATGWAAGP